MAAVGRRMVDRCGTFEFELSPEEEVITEFEAADCARTERSIEDLGGVEKRAVEGK